LRRRPSLRVTRRGSDGFVIEGDGEQPLRMVRGARGSTWEIGASDRAWLLRPSPAGDGLELYERARETEEPLGYLFRADRSGDGSHVLAEDGRLFRVVLRGPRDPHYELAGWEGPGPYIVARPESDGAWKLEPTVAWEGMDREEARFLTVLFVAEILERDGSLPFGESA